MRTMTHGDYLGIRRFTALDGLRAIAATIVVFFHFGGPDWSRLSGWVGVYIFFVLSGFLITTLLLREQDRTGRISLSEFYLRRIFRILPPYLVILAGVTVFSSLRGEFHSRGYPHALPYYLTFLNEFLPSTGGTGDNFFSGSWTLGIEEKFYLVWPLLLVLTGAGLVARKIGLTIAAMTVLLALVGVTGVWVLHNSQATLYVSTIHYFILLVGCLLAILMHYARTYRLIRPLTHPLAAIPVVAVFLVVHTNMEDQWEKTQNNLWLFVLYAAVVALLLIVLIAPGPVRWLLSTAPMRFVGERSYSLYLLQGVAHYIVALTIPQFQAGRTATGLAVFCVALLGADVIHRWVETPLITLGKRVVKRHSDRRDAVVRKTLTAGQVWSRPLTRSSPRPFPGQHE